MSIALSGSKITFSDLTEMSTALSQGVNVRNLGAVGDGVADDTAPIQTALNTVRDSGGTVVFPFGTYRVTAPLTLLRSSSLQALSFAIEGNNSTIQSTITTGSVLKIGATSTNFYIERGGISVSNLIIKGAETTNASSGSSPVGTAVGLELYIAGNVSLNNVSAFSVYTGIKTSFAFPLKAIDCGSRGTWIGLHLDESSNLQDWDNLQTPECRFGILIKSTTTSFDSGKSNNITFSKWWPEGSIVGCVIDSGTTGGGQPRFRSISFYEPYVAGITYDAIRVATQFNFSAPQTRGADCTEFIYDLRIVDGLWNINYSATKSAIVFDTTNRVRGAYIDAPIASLDASSYSWLNSPAGGQISSRGLPNTADAGKRIGYVYNSSGSLVLKYEDTGTITFSNSQGVRFGNETLNAYDEGTFTPTIVGVTTAGSATYSSQSGRFTRIGNRVFFDIVLAWSGHTGTGLMRVSGLPVTTNASSFGSVTFGNVENIALGTNYYLAGLVLPSSTQISLIKLNTGTSIPANVSVSASGGIRLSGSYDV